MHPPPLPPPARTRRTMTLLCLAAALPAIAIAQTLDRAWSLQELTRNKVTGLAVRATWAEDGSALTYSLGPAPAGAPATWRVDLGTGEKRALAPEEEAEAAAPVELTWRAPGSCRSGGSAGEETSVEFINRTTNIIVISWITDSRAREEYGRLGPGEMRAQHTYAGHAWEIADTNGTALACLVARREPGTAVITAELCANPPPPAPPPEFTRRERPGGLDSPDGQWRIAFRDHDAYLAGPDDTAPRALTGDGTAAHTYGPPVSWSPDSRWVMVTRRQVAPERRVTIIDSAPDDQLQPRVDSYSYPKPGDAIDHDRPVLFRVPDGARVDVEDKLFPNPWWMRGHHWAPDASELFIEYNQRGHQVYRVLAIDPAAATARTVIEEKSPTFVDYSNKIDGRHLDGSNHLLWMSERDGWNHLYVVDRAPGGAIRQLTRGEWVVRGIDRVDEATGQVWFRLMGIDPDQDPYHVHFARINLDGTGFTRLTRGNGTHALAYSPGGQFYIDTWSRVDQPPVHELRRSTDGELVCELGRADDAALRAVGWQRPEPLAAKGRDGVTDIWGVIYRPTDFDPARSYPVIESIYAGPQDHHVPKTFAPHRETQALAELGFIVVQIDGMGTNWRSKAFHDVAWKNLKDAGFPDRIAWLHAAAERYPGLDLSRVGVYGGSAGGQNAMRAVLDFPEFYRAAAADCGCHDNRMDKIWWNEAWMGWPVDESYTRSSNVADAHKLGGALLLTVGELDRNVDPASTLQVVDALIRVDKDFDLIVFPGRGHGAGSSPYGRRRLYQFFLRHLLPAEGSPLNIQQLPSGVPKGT